MSNSIMFVPMEAQRHSPSESGWLLQSTLDSCPWNTHRCFINPHKTPIQRRIIRFVATCFLICFSASSSFKISVQILRDTEKQMRKHIAECALNNSISASDFGSLGRTSFLKPGPNQAGTVSQDSQRMWKHF